MLQTAHTAVAAALLLIWVQLMRALDAGFSTAAQSLTLHCWNWCWQPHGKLWGHLGADSYSGYSVEAGAWAKERLRIVICLHRDGRWSWCHLHAVTPGSEWGLEQQGCSASAFPLTHPRPQTWPLHLRERSSRGRRESWASWQGNSSLVAGSNIGTERFLLPDCYGKSCPQLNA